MKIQNSVFAKRLLEFVISSDILEKYRLADTSLNEIVTQASKTKNAWNNHPDISIGVASSNDTPRREAIFRRRLRTMPDNPVNDELREAVILLVNYCASNPKASICTVAFNSSEHNYDFFCGEEEGKIVLICVIVGRPIPKDLFKYA